jgi:hypothetical protein
MHLSCGAIDEKWLASYCFCWVVGQNGAAVMSQAGKLQLTVECERNRLDEATPVRFSFGTRMIEIDEVLDRWPDQAHRYFKVRGNDAGIYILRHDSRTNHWELIMFDSDTHPDSKLSST